VLLALVACDQLLQKDFEPSGSDYQLNSNIRVIAIAGDPQTVGTGTFTLRMTIASKTSNVETATLPGGLTFRRRKNTTQHLLVLKPQTITTGTGSNSVLVRLGVFCLNKRREPPTVEDTFDIGPVTDNEDLRLIADSVLHKDISDGNDMWMVQHAVYMVTDSSGLPQVYVDSIRALPPDSSGLH
jgi:hypothetical protein